jgi:lathosterol oxidase
MDVALELLDPIVFDKAYAWALPHPGASFGNSTDAHSFDAAPTSLWARDNIYRQSISIMLITQFGACSLYFIFSALSYFFLFDRRLEYHPRFLKNQVRQEIKSSMTAVPFINLLTLPWFLAEVRGHSLLYGDNKYGWSWLLFSSVLYMAFNDVAIYWIHRLEHHPSVYKYIHKPHHKWIGNSPLSLMANGHVLTTFTVPTPWAALAFHPLDGYVQSLPYQYASSPSPIPSLILTTP